MGRQVGTRTFNLRRLHSMQPCLDLVWVRLVWLDMVEIRKKYPGKVGVVEGST